MGTPSVMSHPISNRRGHLDRRVGDVLQDPGALTPLQRLGRVAVINLFRGQVEDTNLAFRLGASASDAGGVVRALEWRVVRPSGPGLSLVVLVERPQRLGGQGGRRSRSRVDAERP